MEEVKTISDLAQLGAGIAMGFGAIGAGLGIGVATKGLMDAISRQPLLVLAIFYPFDYLYFSTLHSTRPRL